jgi:hypothetical protein
VALETANDPLLAAVVFRDFFRCFGNFKNIARTDHRDLEREVRGSSVAETVLGQLDQMEDDFPSAGEYSRSDFFWWSFRRKVRSGNEDVACVAVKIMAVQLKQNAVVAALDDALRTWKPVTEMSRIIMSYLLSEFVQMYSFPRIPGMPKRTAGLDAIEAPDIRRIFADFFREERMAESCTAQLKKTKHRVVSSSLPELMELDDLSSLLSIP